MKLSHLILKATWNGQCFIFIVPFPPSRYLPVISSCLFLMSLSREAALDFWTRLSTTPDGDLGVGHRLTNQKVFIQSITAYLLLEETLPSVKMIQEAR